MYTMIDESVKRRSVIGDECSAKYLRVAACMEYPGDRIRIMSLASAERELFTMIIAKCIGAICTLVL